MWCISSTSSSSVGVNDGRRCEGGRLRQGETASGKDKREELESSNHVAWFAELGSVPLAGNLEHDSEKFNWSFKLSFQIILLILKNHISKICSMFKKLEFEMINHCLSIFCF